MPDDVTGLTPYQPRTIMFLGLHEASGTTLKVYGISRTAEPPAAASVAAAKRLAGDYLAAPRASHVAAGVDWSALRTHGLGSLIVHAGREGTFVLVDVWVDENMLRHHAWVARHDSPERFESLAPSDVAICIWELAVVQQERAAWLRHMLTASGRSDRAAYLADVLDATL